MSSTALEHDATTSRPPLPAVLWAAIRPATLPAAVVPVVVGTAVAGATLGWRPALALAALGVALALQIGCNLVNDAADFLTGADDARRLGPARAAQRGWLTPGQLALAAGLAFAVAAGLGLVVALAAGPWLVAVGLAAIAAAIAYTAGPLRLGYLGLGDVTVFVFFGPVAVVGTTFVQTGAAPAEAIVASIPVGLLTTAILVVNNLRDRATDAAVGKRTFAVRFGERATRRLYAALVAAAAVVPLAAVALGVVGPGWLLPLLAAPLAAPCLRALAAVDGAALNPWLGRTARLLLAYGALLAVGVSL